MNPAVLEPSVQDYIQQHLKDDVTKILLKKSPFDTVSSKELATQIESKRAAEGKLPTWFNAPGIYYPVKLSIEQTSSEITALYKSGLARGETLLDVTGGFGVDSYYFSKIIPRVSYCELNSELAEIAASNFKRLNAKIDVYTSDGITFLKETTEEFDTIYIDPARRVRTKKVFLLSDCEPDAVSNFPLLLQKGKRILIKTSPVLDIQAGLRELSQVSEIHVVSYKNECKELVWVVDAGYSGEARIVCAAAGSENTGRLSFLLSEERAMQLETYAPPASFLYDPDVALLKAGAFKIITTRFPLQKLNPNTHLYTSDQFVEEFMGRSFRITASQSYKDFAKTAGTKKANVISRNFPLDTAELKKKHKIQDGGDVYLYFTTGPNGELLTLTCDRIKKELQ